VKFHDERDILLRHPSGTIAVRVFPVSDVQAMLGHADIQTTMRYVHSVPRTDAAKRLAVAFSEDLGGVAVDVRV
jgi:integrase